MLRNGVICAIDINEFDQQVIDLAGRFAKHFDVGLDIVHITVAPDPKDAAWPAYLGSSESVIRENRLLRQVECGVPGVPVQRHHLSGLPAGKLLEFVDHNQPRLLVMGTHGRRCGLARLLGSVATKILRHASCPVMILRQAQGDQNSSSPNETGFQSATANSRDSITDVSTHER